VRRGKGEKRGDEKGANSIVLILLRGEGRRRVSAGEGGRKRVVVFLRKGGGKEKLNFY